MISLLTDDQFWCIISTADISRTDIMRRPGLNETARDPEDLLPLTTAVFHILLALADGERHGYSIMQEVATLTDGKLHLGPGTLYGSIKRMLAKGLIEESDERPDPSLDDERRRYYRLTAFGRRVASAEAQRLSLLVRQAQLRQLLGAQERTSCTKGA
jgi:DNA-binding PadR family transcriptional regulator